MRQLYAVIAVLFFFFDGIKGACPLQNYKIIILHFPLGLISSVYIFNSFRSVVYIT